MRSEINRINTILFEYLTYDKITKLLGCGIFDVSFLFNVYNITTLYGAIVHWDIPLQKKELACFEGKMLVAFADPSS